MAGDAELGHPRWKASLNVNAGGKQAEEAAEHWQPCLLMHYMHNRSCTPAG